MIHHLHSNKLLQLGTIGAACLLAVFSTALLADASPRPLTHVVHNLRRARPEQTIAKGVAVRVHEDITTIRSGKNPEYETLVYSDKGIFKLPELMNIKDRQNVTISGTLSGTKFSPTKVLTSNPRSSKESGRPSNTNSGILVLPVNTTTDPAQPYSAAQIYTKMFSPGGGIYEFYKENSYGKKLLKGYVAPWIQATNGGQYCSNGGAMNLDTIPEVATYLQGNVDLSQYDTVMFLVHGCPKQAYAVPPVPLTLNNNTYTMGLAILYASGDIMSPNTWSTFIEDPWFEVTAIHELGHTMTLNHANGLDCGTIALGHESSCQTAGGLGKIEYGDHFDVMGAIMRGLNFNGQYRDQLGWIDASKKVTITGPGQATIYPINTPDSDKPTVVYLQPAGFTAPLYQIEWRDGSLHDKGMLPTDPTNRSLPQVRMLGSATPGLTSNTSYLIDTNPTEQVWNEDLFNGSTTATWSDNQTGLVLTSKPVTVNGTPAIKLTAVYYPMACSQIGPIANLSPAAPVTIPLGDFVKYDLPLVLQVTDQDYLGCGAQTYTIQRDLEGYSGQYQNVAHTTFSLTVPSFSSGILNPAGLTLPEDTPVGTYNLKYTITNINGSSDPIEVSKTIKVQ